MQDKSNRVEQVSEINIFLQEILKKISESNSNSVVAAAAPDAVIVDLVQYKLIAKGYKASRYGNILSVYIS